MTRIPVTVLGATGVVGQRFLRRLIDHPMFEVACIAASDQSRGKRYRDACEWRLDGEPYGGLGDRILVASDPAEAFSPIAFSALDSGPAREIEPAFARAGAHVFSNAATFRMDLDVPLLVPEVNPGHLALLETQRRNRGWKGSILTNPNCTTTVLVMALAPLHEAFGVETVLMTSMQAVSGAGSPGVPSLDILGNIIPYIGGEEAKVEVETGRLLGRVVDGLAVDDPMAVSALCYRAPVLEGHTESVSVRLKGNPTPDQVREVLAAWKPLPQRLGLPSAPAVPVRVHTAENRPQVRRDVEQDGGMSVHVGRVRPCPVLGIKFALLGHNTERGAAGGSVLNAELAVAQKYVG